MPRIHDYVDETAAEGVINSRRLSEADAVSGAGLKQLGAGMQALGKVAEERAAQDDVTSARVKLAQKRAEWDVAFRDQSMASTPGDENFAPDFVQRVKDDIEKLRGTVTTHEGQRTFDILAADMGGHFVEKAGLFAVQSAGVKATLNWDIAQRAYATSVVTDPLSYQSVLKQAITEIQDPNGQYGRIDANTRLKLETKARDTLAQAYVNGLIDIGAPELARKQLMDGKLDDQLEPKDKQRLIHAADAGITSKRVAAEHADALARREEKKQQDGVNDVLMGKFIEGKLTMVDVRASGLPTFGDGSQNTWVSMLKQQTKEWAEKPIHTNPTVMLDAFESITRPAGDPQKIVHMSDINKLYTQGFVSWADLTHLQKAFNDQQTEDGQRLGTVKSDFMKGIKAQLDKSTMNKLDEAGGERMFRFTVYVNQQVDAARKANQDPYELFNPASPKYLGKVIPQFQTGPQVTQADLAKRINATLDKANEKRKPLKEIFQPSNP